MKSPEQLWVITYAKRIETFANGSQPRAQTIEAIHLQVTGDYSEYGDGTCDLCGVRKDDHHWELEQ